MNTVNCISRISFINGEKGILEYRGYPIEQLAEHSNFLEISFLLVYGQLPNERQIDVFTKRIKSHYEYNPKLDPFIKDFEQNAHPMGMLQTVVACLSSLHPESNPAYYGGQFGYQT
jgi:citrate synthase